MDMTPGLQRTGPLDVELARSVAGRSDLLAFVLPTTGVVDRHTFFDAVKATFQLDPPVAGSRSWDALADSLWQALESCESRRILIVWQGTHHMSTACPTDFQTALDVLADVANQLADPIATRGNVTEVFVLVE